MGENSQQMFLYRAHHGCIFQTVEFIVSSDEPEQEKGKYFLSILSWIAPCRANAGPECLPGKSQHGQDLYEGKTGAEVAGVGWQDSNISKGTMKSELLKLGNSHGNQLFD